VNSAGEPFHSGGVGRRESQPPTILAASATTPRARRLEGSSGVLLGRHVREGLLSSSRPRRRATCGTAPSNGSGPPGNSNRFGRHGASGGAARVGRLLLGTVADLDGACVCAYGTVIMELNWNVNLETYNMRTFSQNVCFWSCTATCAREKKIERVCASVRLRVRGQSKCSLRLANVPRLARLVTSRANKSHLITTEC